MLRCPLSCRIMVMKYPVFWAITHCSQLTVEIFSFLVAPIVQKLGPVFDSAVFFSQREHQTG
jgi:hypothetical protein